MRLTLLAMLLSAAPALAREKTPTADAADIIVTGSSLPSDQGEAAYDVATIDRARLDTNASGRLEDALRDVAGFAQFRRSDSRSAQPTSQGATLRGLGGNASSRALVTLDGVPVTDPFGGWISFAAIDPARLGQVRVTRGGGSGVAGPGALAGTIELESAGPRQLAPAWGEALYGSRDSLETRAGISAQQGGGFGFLTAGYARGDGFIPVVHADRGPVDVAAPYQQVNLAGRAVAPVWTGAELQGSLLAFGDRRTRGTAFTPNSTSGADASLRLVGAGAWGYELLGYYQLRRFSAGFATIDAARATVAPSLDQYDVPSSGAGGRIEVRPPTGARVRLRLGADARDVTGQSDELYSFVSGRATRGRQAGGETLTVGGFAEASATPLAGLTLTAGGRIDRWRIIGGFLRQRLLATSAPITDTGFPDRSGWRPTTRGGAAWKPGGGAVTLRGAAYLGWRLPTLNELYRLYRVGADAVAANAALKPERLRGVDGGVDFDPAPDVHVAATLFTNRLEDAIANVTLGHGPGSFPQVGVVGATGRFQMRENLDAITSRGAEFDARLSLRNWRLSASYAYTDARVHAGGIAAVLDRLRPAETARHQASATLGWRRPKGGTLSATLRYVGPQYEDDLNSEALRGAVTLDAFARLPIGRGAAIILRGENMTDTRVEAGISGADIVERATPRTLWIGLEVGKPA